MSLFCRPAILALSVAAALSPAASSAAAQDTPVPPRPSWTQALTEVSDLRYCALSSGFTTHQSSSFDRTGGNKDWGNYVRVEGSRKVLADLSGPGEIVRIWSANPQGVLNIRLDGAEKPFVMGDFAGCFDGRTPPFQRPLATQSSGGSISYMPIPFSSSALVEAVDAGDFYYQITYRLFPGAAPGGVGSFNSEQSARALSLAQQAWTTPGPLRVSYSRPDPIVTAAAAPQTVTRTIRLRSQASASVAALQGGGYIQDLRLMLPANSVGALRKTRLVIRWDSAPKPGVDVPLLDLFGSAFGLKDHRSLAIGRTNDGWWYVRWPMPFRSSASVSLVNNSASDLRIPVAVQWVKGKPSDDALYYRASFATRKTERGKPYLILEARGEGQFVGTSVTMQGTGGLGFLEGDELISVDGRPHTDFNGTGTEDYFNSGWYFRDGPVAQPMHGCLLKDEPLSRISVYRHHLTDRIPFRSSFRFDLEHGSVNDAPAAGYSSVAHWYSRSPGDEATPVVNARTLGVPRRPAAYPEDAVSLVRLPRTELSGGAIETTTWERISDTVEGGPLLVFRPRNIGNALSLKVRVPHTDRYSVSLWTGGGPGLGMVRASIDGRALGEADLWSAEPNHPRRVVLGTMHLDAGLHDLRLQCSGRHPSSGGLSIIASHIQLESAGPFLRSWRVLGPFDAPAGSGPDCVCISETGDQDLGGEHAGAEGMVAPKQVTAPTDILMLPNRPYSAWYAYKEVSAAEAVDTQLLIGSDDDIKVWVNGQMVHRNQVKRSVARDQDVVPVSLREGVNRILLKIINGDGDCGFVVRMRDTGGVVSWTDD